MAMMHVKSETLMSNRTPHRLDYSHIPWENVATMPILHEDKMTLYLPLENVPIAEHVNEFVYQAAREENLMRVTYSPREKPFIALIGAAQGHSIKEHLTVVALKSGPDVRDALLDDFEEALKRADFSFRLLPCFYRIQRPYPLPTPDKAPSEIRTSIVQLAQVQGLSQFYRDLNWTLGTRLKTPPAYITLFTHSTNPLTTMDGISIPTEEAFKDWVLESIPPLWQPRK